MHIAHRRQYTKWKRFGYSYCFRSLSTVLVIFLCFGCVHEILVSLFDGLVEVCALSDCRSSRKKLEKKESAPNVDKTLNELSIPRAMNDNKLNRTTTDASVSASS